MCEKNVTPSIVRVAELCMLIGISRSSVYNKWKPSGPYFDPSFPKRVSIGVRTVGVLKSDLNAWISSRVDQSTSPAKGKR